MSRLHPRASSRLSTPPAPQRTAAPATGLTLVLALAAIAVPLPGQESPPSPPTRILFRNVRIFDGVGDALSAPSDVLIRGERIARIGATPLDLGDEDPDAGAITVIDGDGRVLMPGLIDAHAHLTLGTIPKAAAMTADVGYVQIRAGRDAAAMLQRGFTTVRDVGGPTFGLKRAIDEGVIDGPRIYPSGAFISQTGGHGDFRMPHEVPREPMAPLSHSERVGMAAIADGPAEVLLRAREQLRQGATQLKLMAGGGVSSPYDPLDVAQYTAQEFRAAVDAAENWGTYVTVHAYTPRAIRMAVEAGVRCIEHGHLMDEATAKLLAERRVWLCLQPFLDDEDAIPQRGANRVKQLETSAGTDRAYLLAKKHGIRLAFGTDTLFDARLATRQGAQLAKLRRWFTPAEVLRMATSTNAELLAMCGPRNPYPGKLGVVAEAALADLLLVDGDPLQDLDLLADPGRNLLVIVKNGRIHKDRRRG